MWTPCGGGNVPRSLNFSIFCGCSQDREVNLGYCSRAMVPLSFHAGGSAYGSRLDPACNANKLVGNWAHGPLELKAQSSSKVSIECYIR
mmetsp:Transcript_44420/g.93258  ORF Transcript_44420/g.93258 Transcript_44420/m.93258 type:complete len:89 (+) Transcript_44420:1474-1740(+)